MPKTTKDQKKARRGEILAAAMRCFARAGFHPTTIQDICAEAGLSTGAVYTYFSSKDEIIAALASAGRETTDSHAAKSRAETSPLQRLREMLALLDDPRSAIANQVDVRAWAEAIGNPKIRKTYLHSRAHLVESLAEMVAPLAAARDLDPHAIAELIASIIAGTIVRRAIEPKADIKPQIGTLLALLNPSSKRNAA